MPRFFISDAQIFDTSLTIEGDDAFHIARSLRMAVGDPIVACDTVGTEYRCRITHIRDDAVRAEILSAAPGATESPVDVTLYVAFPKGDKLETILQKAVELGARRIVPFSSSRCIKRPNTERQEKITARLCRIALEAAKQCGRSRIPTVSAPLSFSDMISEGSQSDLPLFCYEGEGTRSLRAILGDRPTAKTIAVVIGCEGGFSPQEAEAARDAGFLLTGLGTRILRCETAPDFVLSAISYHFELPNA